MLKTFLISYDLIGGEPRIAYQKLREAITGVSFWAKPLESVYIIKSDLSAVEVARRLRLSMHASDRLLVIEIGKDWGSVNLSVEVINWLRSNL